MSNIRFLDYELRLATRQLVHRTDSVPLGARALDLLVMLIENRNRVVSRDEVMEYVWPGVIVGDNNLNVQVANLRRILGRSAVVTVPGRGLRFGLEVSHETARRSDLPLPDRPSIVVLPFSVIGDDADLMWLADGFVEDITTELSRFRDLFVVARNSALNYRDAPLHLREVSRELGVRYVVEGSVRAVSGQVRVAAHLIDATNCGYVWAENFDSAMKDHFFAQRLIVQAIVTSLVPQIDHAEAARVASTLPEDLTAYGLAQRGWAVISAGDMAYDPAPRDHAFALAQKALTIDPNSGRALRTLAWVNWWHVYHGTTESVPATLADGSAAANRAISIDPSDHHALRLRGLLSFIARQPEAGLDDLRMAHHLNPNCAVTLAWLGMYEATHGDPSKGIPSAEAALRLSPRDPARGSLLAALGFAQFSARDYSAAARTAEAALREYAGSATPLVLGTIAYVGTGQIEKAASIFHKLQQIAPNLVEARLKGIWLSTNPDYLQRAHTFFRVAAGLEAAATAAALR